MNSYVNEERAIDIKRLAIEYFKLWRIILIAALAGAIVLAGFCALKAPGVIAPNETLVATNQKQIDSNNASIAELQKSINNNNAQISSNRNTIPVRENDIAAAKIKLEGQQKDLNTYEKLYAEANRLINNASTEIRTELIAQISDLTDKISLMKAEIKTTEGTIAGYENEIAGMQYAIDTSLPASNEHLNTRIAELQQQNEELAASMNPQAKDKSVGDFAKFAIIGCVLGAFAVACYVLARFLFNTKIYCGEAVDDYYNIPVLADLHLSAGKYNTRLDLMLEKWNGERREIDANEEYRLLAAKLCAVCPEGVDNIVIISSVDDPCSMEVCDNVAKYMKDGISICVAGNPMYNAEAALRSKNACSVIVEKAGKSVYSETTRVIELLSLSNSRILGFVLV